MARNSSMRDRGRGHNSDHEKDHQEEGLSADKHAAFVRQARKKGLGICGIDGSATVFVPKTDDREAQSDLARQFEIAIAQCAGLHSGTVVRDHFRRGDELDIEFEQGVTHAMAIRDFVPPPDADVADYPDFQIATRNLGSTTRIVSLDVDFATADPDLSTHVQRVQTALLDPTGPFASFLAQLVAVVTITLQSHKVSKPPKPDKKTKNRTSNPLLALYAQYVRASPVSSSRCDQILNRKSKHD